MKKRAYESSKLKYQLLNKKRNGVKEVIWKLSPSQVEFIQRKFGFYIEPYLYEVKTRTFCNIKNLDTLLKDLHYKSKQGKKFTVIKLTRHQKDVLDTLGIKYKPYKYRIKLA